MGTKKKTPQKKTPQKKTPQKKKTTVWRSWLNKRRARKGDTQGPE